ncbi:hypothetical protein ENSA5_68480 [Enhygromyxa salina]|uniref:Uncharacterized protein n=1 Tax=Enhygromyxa salina TaxID=215803 RepID=A0A2S9XB15_9BACT|nr:hypothetical protein [Enhygromyxa salina]PRP90045.1 hypothetical protein ENSA5_68480 [Enhygromyxa salina]
MSKSGRRGFCRALGGLACLGLGGCKIEPILGIADEREALPLAFPDLPPQIPDQLEDAETTLRALTEELLQREIPRLTSGGLRERASGDPSAVSHFVELMRGFGLAPAGNRGGWVQPVMLDIVEPTGDVARVRLRPESEAPFKPAEAPPKEEETPPTEAETASKAGETPPEGEAPPEGETPEPAPPPKEPDAPPEPEPELPSRAIELGALGAFRQRGDAVAHERLLLGPVLSYETPLPASPLAGRVAVFRAPKGLDLSSDDAPARVDTLMSTVRDTGAVGCLLLTRDDGPGIERFRELWQRQVRRAGAGDEALLIEGLVAAEARKPIEAALGDDEAWMLEVNLATHSYVVESHNVLGRVTGREQPDEAVVLTCAWDTPDPRMAELHTIRLLATLGAFFQLAEWSRRSTPTPYSLVLLLTADAGLAAGQSVHAAWSANYGAETVALVALDRPMTSRMPAAVLSGHYDAGVAELARRVVAADGRELLLDDQLSMPSLAPYLRYPAPVMTIGAGDPDTIVDVNGSGDADEDEGEGEATAAAESPLDGLHADIRLLRNLVLALAARR